PGIATMGWAAYFKYMLTMVFIYCLMLFSIEAFQFFNLKLLLMRTIFSTIFTFIIIYAIDSLSFKRS
ncbi:MAG: rod shape-determining protein MreD, partial [Muribaculaceae bacterium]|nr:rod shape-determining protein MreD [Muribaculaceae bacterium]